MLNNKFLIFISVLAVAAVIIVSLQLEKKSRKLPPVINALPAEVSFFLETDDFNYFLNIEKVKFYETLAEAKKAVLKVGIKTETEYRKRRKEDPRLPSTPARFYSRKKG